MKKIETIYLPSVCSADDDTLVVSGLTKEQREHIEEYVASVRKPKEPKFKAGDEVYYILDNVLVRDIVTEIVDVAENEYIYATIRCEGVCECELHKTKDELFKYLEDHENERI